MLNFIWCFFIIISIIYSIIFGSFTNVNNSIFEAMQSTVSLIISLFGSMCFWNGIMNIVKNTSMINKIKFFINPLIKKLFPNIDENSDCYKNISMNMTSNLLGLGNSATPCGLKAIEEMQKENINKDKLTNNQILFILINTASIQLIPTTIISIRTSLNSKNPSVIILSVWFASIITFLVMIFITKIYFKFRNKKLYSKSLYTNFLYS